MKDKMNHLAKKIFFITIFISITALFFPPSFTFAQNFEYTVLEPLPETTNCGKNIDSPECKTTLETYLPGMFKLLIGIAGVFAVLMIVVGGFQYMTTDSLMDKKDGKQRIINSIKGLFLVIGAWLILNTINPKLLEINLNLEPVKIEPKVAGEFGPPADSGDRLCPEGRCVLIPNSIGMKSKGMMVDQVMLPKLNQFSELLKESGIDLFVTEAYPPTRKHQCSCHKTGTCIDARKVADDKVKTFIDSALNSGGLKAEYEVETPTRKNDIIKASCGNDENCRKTLEGSIKVLPRKADGTPQITGEHFSVYNTVCNG